MCNRQEDKKIDVSNSLIYLMAGTAWLVMLGIIFVLFLIVKYMFRCI